SHLHGSADNLKLKIQPCPCRRKSVTGAVDRASGRRGSVQVKQRSQPGAQGGDQQVRIAGFVQSRHRTEAVRQVGEAVATQEQERVAACEQMVGQRIDHRTVQIDIENGKIEFLVQRRLHRLVELPVRPAHDGAARVQQFFKLKRQQKFILHQEDRFSVQENSLR